jgi:hypothetical protein
MDMINARLVPDAQAVLTPGAAVAGMSLHGLGFANRPLSLTPQCFANTPLDLVCRDGIRADRFNRVKLGRTRDEAYAYGCDLVLQELARAVCAHAGMDRRFNHLDTTSGARRGDDVPDSAEQAIRIPPGDSKDHRPDLKPAVWELMVSPDGGVPCVSKSWEGTTADTQIGQARAQAFMPALKTSPRPQYRMADATLSPADNAATLHGLGFITRLAHTLGLVSHVSAPALTWDTWQACDETTRDQGVELGHDDRAQRWLVVSAPAALARAAATVTKATQRDAAAIATPLLHVPAQRFATPEAAPDALATWAKGWPDHPLESSTLLAHQRSAGQGRPTLSTPRNDPQWHIQAHGRPAEAAIWHRKPLQAGVVLGTTRGAHELSDAAVMTADTRQCRVEGGVRLLKDPLFVVASLCVKKPCRL